MDDLFLNQMNNNIIRRRIRIVVILQLQVEQYK